MPSSSNERVRFARPPADMRLTLEDPVQSGGFRRPTIDIKELQRRAFERGVATEREAAGAGLRDAVARLASELEAAAVRRRDDERRIEEFAVRLAVLVAQELTRAVIEEGAHDVAGMVHTLLGEFETPGDEPIRVRLHPSDHGRLLGAEITTDAGRRPVALEPDPALAPGSFVVSSEGTEYYSLLNERLEALRCRLIEESRDGDA